MVSEKEGVGGVLIIERARFSFFLYEWSYYTSVPRHAPMSMLHLLLFPVLRSWGRVYFYSADHMRSLLKSGKSSRILSSDVFV